MIDSRPVSPSILKTYEDKQRRDREELVKRASKTLNVAYDPQKLKPFLKQLAKKDAAHKMRPLGFANESRFPAELRIKYQFMLGPVIHEDPTMFNVMGHRNNNDTDDEDEKDQEKAIDSGGNKAARRAFVQTNK